LSTATQESISIHNPQDFAAAIPTLVGFQPRESIVTVLIKHGRVLVTVRVDIPETWAETQDYLVETVTSIDPDSVLLALCTSRGSGDLPHAPEVMGLTAGLAAAAAQVHDVLLIDGDRFWSYLCHEATCGNPHGTVFEPGTDIGRLDALRTRQDLVAHFALRPDRTPPREAFQAAVKALKGCPREAAEAAWAAVQNLAGGSQDETQRALVQLGLSGIIPRDYVLARIARHEDPQPLVDVLVDLALCSPDQIRSRLCGAAAALLAATQDSSLPATTLCSHAGDDSLAELVQRCVIIGTPPSNMRALLRDSLPLVLAQMEEPQ
jgi:hypothetical protein